MTSPIISGFHPDPSICRAGNIYYIANSSFEYVPGVPIHRSTDLVNWELCGHALTRPDQLPPHSGAANSGIYAPTLRHHDGRFWMVTTDIGQIRRGHLIVHAENPEGPWSQAVHVADTLGIDPDLVWDEAGTCHLTWASFHPQLHGIANAPVDPLTGTLLGEPRLLWPGTGLAAPEGPHLYRIEGWWYLLLAEGGTERGHAVTMARSRSLEGPWEPAPANPVLTHRSTDHPVQNTGHADLVQTCEGEWAMVYLGVRPHGQTPHFHVLGRETFLAGLQWVDGWPVVDESRYPVKKVDHSFTDTFDQVDLHPRWVAAGTAARNLVRSETPGLAVLPVDETSVPGPGILATRVRDLEWTAEVDLEAFDAAGCFMLWMDEAHWFGLRADRSGVEAVAAIGPAVARVGRTAGPAPATPQQSAATLRISARSAPGPRPSQPDLIELAVVRGEDVEVLACLDGRYLSTEVAGGFTGRMLAVRAHGGRLRLTRFSYCSGPSDSSQRS